MKKRADKPRCSFKAFKLIEMRYFVTKHHGHEIQMKHQGHKI